MEAMRGIFGILVGYLVTALVAMGVVSSLFAGAEQEPATKTILVALGAVALGAAVGGFLCTLILGSANHPAIYVTIGVMIAMTVFAHATGRAIEPNWYKVVGLMTQAGAFLIGASSAAYRLER